MYHASLRKTFAAALGLLLASAAAPIALADVPGYLFQDFDQHSSANASGGTANTSSGSAASTTIAAPIAAANRKADQALATAQQALREAQRASASREAAPAVSAPTRDHSRPIVDGHHVQPRRDDMCSLSQHSSDCRGGTANGVDNDLLQQILRRAAS
jgi:hypothetical protein